MSKHAQGPWYAVRPDWAYGWWVVSHDEHGGVCVDESGDGGFEESTARLIAAAPDLLEACQTFAEWLRREDEGLPAGIVRDTPEGEQQWRIWYDENIRICNLAQERSRAAIAKARGEA